MNFADNLKAFLRALPLKRMSGHQKFLAVASKLCGGKTGIEAGTKEVKAKWRKSLLGVRYNPSFYDRAQREGWVDPVAGVKGRFSVTSAGADHLTALAPPDVDSNTADLKRAGSVVIVNRKATYTFDKFLRKGLAEAKTEVLVADSWVDENVFDGILDVVPKTIPLKLIYANSRGSFDQRAKRFGTEYRKFDVRKYKVLHDRFMIIDDTAYVLGPSIKGAASNSPALVVVLDGKEKRLLHSFFNELWSKAK
jgi:hypothetical protein